MLIFNYEDLATDKAAKSAAKALGRSGSNVVNIEVDPRIRRSSGVPYREMSFTIADGQLVTVSVKQTGDIFQVKLNGATKPIKEQHDQEKAISEISDYITNNSKAFQKKQAAQKVALPPSIRSAAVKTEDKLKARSVQLDSLISDKTADISAEQARITADNAAVEAKAKADTAAKLAAEAASVAPVAEVAPVAPKPAAKKAPKKAPSAVEVPANAEHKRTTLEIKAVGRKWFEVTRPDSTFVMNMAITPETANLKVGDTLTNILVGEVKVFSKYGTKITLYPIPEDQTADVELNRWLGWFEEAARKGYIYEKGLAKLKEFGAMAVPEYAERIMAAEDLVAETDITQAPERAIIRVAFRKATEAARKGEIDTDSLKRLKGIGAMDSVKYAEDIQLIQDLLVASNPNYITKEVWLSNSEKPPAFVGATARDGSGSVIALLKDDKGSEAARFGSPSASKTVLYKILLAPTKSA